MLAGDVIILNTLITKSLLISYNLQLGGLLLRAKKWFGHCLKCDNFIMRLNYHIKCILFTGCSFFFGGGDKKVTC